MVWVRFDDIFPINRKVDSLSDPAFRLHVSAIFWCARNLTDGAVPEEDLDALSPRKVRRPDMFVPELVGRGLWHLIGSACGSDSCPAHPHNASQNSVITGTSGGWVIHDYLEYQFSKERVEADRKANAERQARHRERQRESNGVSHGVTNGVSHGGSNGTPTRPVSTTSFGSSTHPKSKEPKPIRPEVIELCELLAGLVEKNGFPRPEITSLWLDECRRLMDIDRKTVEQIRTAIVWSTGHKRFWWKNIRSMPKLRKQWDELAAQAYAEKVEASQAHEQEPLRVVASDDARCEAHPRQLAGHCALCAADSKGRAA